MSYGSSNTRWWGKFYTWGNDRSRVITLGSGRSGGDIVQYSWNKSVTNPGRLTLQILPHRTINYASAIRPDSTVEFWVDDGRAGVKPQLFTAFVDRVSTSRSVDSNGREKRTIEVSCSDITKKLKDLILLVTPSFQNIEVLLKQVTALRALTGEGVGQMTVGKGNDLNSPVLLRPPDFMWRFLSTYMPSAGVSTGKYGLDFRLPDPSGGTGKGETLLSILDQTRFVAPARDFPYGNFIYMSKKINAAKNLWDLVSVYSHSLLNELFIDTRPASEGEIDPAKAGEAHNAFVDSSYQKPATVTDFKYYYGLSGEKGDSDRWAPRVIMRPRPYLSGDLLDLKRHEIDATQLSALNIGRSNTDIKNMFRVIPDFVGKRVDAISYGDLRFALANVDSMVKHGLKRFEPLSSFVWKVSAVAYNQKFKVKASSSYVVEATKEQVEKIALQNYRNDFLLNGLFTTAGSMTDLRVGNALRYTDKRYGEDLMFYIEGVSHQGSSDSRSRSSISVTRGLPKEDYDRGEDDIIFSANSKGMRYIKFNERLK